MKDKEHLLEMNMLVTYGCDSIFSSEKENLGIENWDNRQKRPDKDVVEEPERAVDGASERHTKLRGVVEVGMVETENS